MPEAKKPKDWRPPPKPNKPGTKIISHPQSDAYNEGWQRIWGKKRKAV